MEEVRKQKLRLIQQRRNFLEQRLLVADANRRAELKRRILKAHDEEIKGREIAFIQVLLTIFLCKSRCFSVAQIPITPT